MFFLLHLKFRAPAVYQRIFVCLKFQKNHYNIWQHVGVICSGNGILLIFSLTHLNSTFLAEWGSHDKWGNMKYKWTLSGGSLEQRNTAVKFRNKYANGFGIEGFTKTSVKIKHYIPVHWTPLKEPVQAVRSRGNACMHTHIIHTYVHAAEIVN